MDPRLVNRLSSEELKYEMEIRGLVSNSVDEMRKLLRAALKRDSSFLAMEYPFTFEEDKAAILKKLDEIEKLVTEIGDKDKASEVDKIEAKCAHILGRLGQVMASEPTSKEFVRASRKRVAEVCAVLDITAAGSGEHSSTPIPGEARANLPLSPQPVGFNIEEERGVFTPSKVVPVYKWNLHFSGEPGESISAFLDRVEELRVARGYLEDELYRSAIDLFEGKATVWFRANRSFISTWKELVIQLKLEFQPPGYDDRLWEEIKHRTQGRNETIGMYVSVMQGLFSRLNERCGEAKVLEVIRQNLTPFYQMSLTLIDITSVRQLVEVGRKLEVTQYSVSRYAPPPSRRQGHLMEPDLAYMEVSGRDFQEVNAVNYPSQPITCYRCRQPGHVASACPQPVRCYGCGAIGVIRIRCNTCNPSGNGRTSH